MLLSSHILAEVQQVCHSVSIIGNGRLLASGPVEDLLGESSVPHARRRRRPGPGAAALLEAAGYARRRATATTLRRRGRTTHPEEITRLLAGEQLYVPELTAIRPDLESVFLQLTRDRPAEDAG